LLEVPRQYLLYLLFIFGAGFEMARLHFSSPSFGEVKEEALLVSPIRKADRRTNSLKSPRQCLFWHCLYLKIILVAPCFQAQSGTRMTN